MVHAKQWRVVHMLSQGAVNHRWLRWHSGICAGLRTSGHGRRGLRRPSKAPLTSGPDGAGLLYPWIKQTWQLLFSFFEKLLAYVGTADPRAASRFWNFGLVTRMPFCCYFISFVKTAYLYFLCDKWQLMTMNFGWKGFCCDVKIILQNPVHL